MIGSLAPAGDLSKEINVHDVTLVRVVACRFLERPAFVRILIFLFDCIKNLSTLLKHTYMVMVYEYAVNFKAGS